MKMLLIEKPDLSKLDRNQLFEKYSKNTAEYKDLLNDSK